MELPHRKAAQTTVVLTIPRLITERFNVQEGHFLVPGSEHQVESRTTPPKVLPALPAPARIRGGAVPARILHRRVHLPGPGNCANGYLSQVGGRRAGCWQESSCGARYVAVAGGGGRSRGCAFSSRIRDVGQLLLREG